MNIKKENKEQLEKNKEEFDKKKMEVKEFKDYIEGKFKEYSDKYIIIDFVSIHFHYLIDRKPEFLGDFGGELVFDFQYSHPYRQCHINVHKLAYDMWEKGQTDSLEGGILHELAHLHTHKLSDMAKNRYADEKELMAANEELTQIISEYIRRNKALMQENITLKGRSNVREKSTETKKTLKQKRINN